MEAMRQSWTDERLDDFREETARRFEEARAETARRFDEVERRLDTVDADMRELRSTMSAGFDRVDTRLDRMDARLDALSQAIFKFGGGALVTFVVGFVGLIATQL
ncbi:MAG TPA: hypothetical protein VEQ41_06155 [Solirubrobacterales bacterium]|nr:hypothetical protein [Solirubrobacterales bacterium]